MGVNWDQLRDQLGAQLGTSLQGIVEGAANDIAVFANAIAAEMVLALSTGDEAGVEELKAQLHVIAELNRIRVAKEQEQTVLKLIGVVLNVATSGLLAAGASLGKSSGA